MIVSFTQTYTNRPELIDIYFKDKRMLEFKNKFDLNIYAFHNCPDSVVTKFNSQNRVQNTKYLIYKKLSYTETVKQTVDYLNSINCKYLFFSQDDTFSFDNANIDFDELLKYVKSNESNFMLNLRDYYKGNYDESKILNFDTFNIYPSNTIDDRHFFWWPFDDSTFIASMDLVNEIYDEEYFKQRDIWNAEKYLMAKYAKKKLNRYVTDKRLFQNYNILGKTISLRKQHLNELKDRGFL